LMSMYASLALPSIYLWRMRGTNTGGADQLAQIPYDPIS
jgi:hypothetical protein